MSGRKIDAMHHFYGYDSGFCRECPHFVERKYDRTYFKCSVYGTSHSAATDWAKSYIACGLIDKPFPADETRIVTRVSKVKEDNEQLPGQIAMEI